MSTQPEPSTTQRTEASREPTDEGASWATLVRVGAIAIILSIVALELVVIQEIVPPLVAIGVLLIVGLVLMSRTRRAGVIMVAVLATVFAVFSAPFVPESLAFPASTTDFVINLVSMTAWLAIVVGVTAILRAGSIDARSGVARRFGTALLALVVVGTGFSVIMRLTREDPLGQPLDVTVTAEDTEFSPTRIELAGIANPAGEGLSFFIQNEDLTAHTFTIDELDVDEAIPGGGSARVELSDVASGTYEYYCTVTGHDDMKGTLTIETNAT